MNLGFRRGSGALTTELDVILNFGGLGDMVCRLPALKQLLTIPHVSTTIFAPRYFLDVAQAVLGPAAKVKPLDEAPKPPVEKPTIDFTPYTFTSMRMHLVQNAFVTLLDRIPALDSDEAQYLKLDLSQVDIRPFQLPAKYAVITTGHTAPVREFLPSTVNTVVEYCRATGLAPVFLGAAEIPVDASLRIKAEFSTEIDFSKGLDLRGKTSLFEAAKIMAGAAFTCGVDNGLLHLAGMTDAPIVAGYTSTTAGSRVPLRGSRAPTIAIVPRDLECAGCQTNMPFVYGHDFRKCFYQDYKCVKGLTPGLFIEAIKRIMGGRQW